MGIWINNLGEVFDDTGISNPVPETHNGLMVVALAPQPTDPTLVITGYTVSLINGVQTQVWQTRTAVPADFLAAAKDALVESDAVFTRAGKQGRLYPSTWQTRDAALRAIINGANGPLPDYPRNPDGSIAYP